MNQNIKHSLKLLGQSILFWTLAMFFYGIFRYYGADEELATFLKSDIISNRMISGPLTVLSVMGIGFGIVYAIIDFLFEKYKFKKVSLGLNFLIKIFLHFIVIIIIVSTVINLASNIIDINIDTKFGWWLYDKRFWSALFYIVIFSFIFSFIKIAIERFGANMFLKIVKGTYTNPKEEKRIFMFLDLKNSTTIAETLGHHKYSQFIQDCFLNLNEVIQKYDAEIYQYVGDEAVLCWSYKKGIKNNNCVASFFAFQQRRQSKKKYYLKKYGVFPEFKAGLHGGSVMVAEVGSVKKELAYHGDVINTSARIQAECNTYNVDILLSEKLLKDLNMNKFSNSKFLGSVLLKGKKQEIKINTIQV